MLSYPSEYFQQIQENISYNRALVFIHEESHNMNVLFIRWRYPSIVGVQMIAAAYCGSHLIDSDSRATKTCFIFSSYNLEFMEKWGEFVYYLLGLGNVLCSACCD